jgi:hypothetical protein
VTYELPVFYYNPPIKERHQFECGYEIERRLFPNLENTSKVYAKDYKFIKEIENPRNRRDVGDTPHNKHEKKYYCSLRESN